MVWFSAFNGMSCGNIAADITGLKVDKYYSSEIKKSSIAVTQNNYPNTIQLGSIVDIDVFKLDPINILIGGSPCQSFSFAGKMAGMSSKCEKEITTLEQYLDMKNDDFEFEGQSYLFWEYARILKDIQTYNPNVIFLLENVKMLQKWENIISEALNYYPIEINSALLSAQNRKRLYWTNISGIKQPSDNGILLRDILESEVSDNYVLSNGDVSRIGKWNSTSNPIKTAKTELQKSSCCTSRGIGEEHSDMQLLKIYKAKMNIICGALRGRYKPNGIRVDNKQLVSGQIKQELELRNDGKNNTLISVQKDNVVVYPKLIVSEATKKGFIEVENGNCFDLSQANSKTRRGRDMSKKCNTLMASNMDYMCYEYPKYRKLTPVECERLQTVPDNFTEYGVYLDSSKKKISNRARYKMLGNGWTVHIIAHIFKYINTTKPLRVPNYVKQYSLF